MFRKLAQHFGVGLATVLPFFLVIWVLIAIFQWVDGLFGPLIERWTGVHVPGTGFVLVVVVTTLIGAMTRLYVSRRILTMMDALFARIPFVKSLYSMFKELVQNVMGERRGFQRVVMVDWPDERARLVGFVTNEHLPPALDPDGSRVAVYLPNAFQVNGVTAIVERCRVHPCHLSVEEAFKFAFSAGLGQHSLLDDALPPNARAQAEGVHGAHAQAVHGEKA